MYFLCWRRGRERFTRAARALEVAESTATPCNGATRSTIHTAGERLGDDDPVA